MKILILDWIRSGADKEGYEEKITTILNRDCLICHNPSVNPALPNLTNYQGVAEVAHAGGATVPALVRVSHIHLFVIAFIFLSARYFFFAILIFI